MPNRAAVKIRSAARERRGRASPVRESPPVVMKRLLVSIKSSLAVARHFFARGASIAARRSMIVMATLVSMSASPAAIAAC